MNTSLIFDTFEGLQRVITGGGGGGGGDPIMIRRVCATNILNLPACSVVEKPKKYTLFWSYHSFLKKNVLNCTGDKDHIYALLIKSKPFYFSSTMFVQKSFKSSVTAISLSYEICNASQKTFYRCG